MNFATLLLVFGLTTAVTITFIRGSYTGCEYKKCDWRGSGTHYQCITKKYVLVRDVKCSNSNSTYHICCDNSKFRSDQELRQKWFRSVVYLGDRLSRPCTKRILCEQSCLDGLKSTDGEAQSSHPQFLPTDPKETRDYVLAYTDGERRACFGDGNPNFTNADCKSFCASRYGGCERAMENSLPLQLYYYSSWYFHRLGMWLFTLNRHYLRDTYKRVAENVNANVELAIEQEFSKLLVAMEDLDSEFENWKKKYFLDGPKYSAKHYFDKDGVENIWKQFLYLRRSNIDIKRNYFAKLLCRSLGYEEFTKDMMYIRETLEEAPFERNRLTGNSESDNEQSRSRSGRGSGSVKVIMGLLLFACITVGLLVILLVCYYENLSPSTVSDQASTTASKAKSSTSTTECAEVTAKVTAERTAEP